MENHTTSTATMPDALQLLAKARAKQRREKPNLEADQIWMTLSDYLSPDEAQTVMDQLEPMARESDAEDSQTETRAYGPFNSKEDLRPFVKMFVERFAAKLQEEGGDELVLKIFSPGEKDEPGEDAEEDEVLEVTTVIEERVQKWFETLPLSSKLAVVAYSVYIDADHGTDEWMGEILDGFEREILAAVDNPPANLTGDERLMLGVACEGMLWLSNH
jgi:hypothetical protein